MTDHAFPETWRRGLYETITRRRDMRAFLPDPIPDEMLARILMAAHQAGSVESFPERPIFERNGWLPRLQLHELVFHDQWDERPRPDLLRALETSRIDGAKATPTEIDS